MQDRGHLVMSKTSHFVNQDILIMLELYYYLIYSFSYLWCSCFGLYISLVFSNNTCYPKERNGNYNFLRTKLPLYAPNEADINDIYHRTTSTLFGFSMVFISLPSTLTNVVYVPWNSLALVFGILCSRLSLSQIQIYLTISYHPKNSTLNSYTL